MRSTDYADLRKITRVSAQHARSCAPANEAGRLDPSMNRVAEKPKRGRPPKPPGQVRHRTTGVAFTTSELERVRKLAAREGKSIGEYIRTRLPL